MGPARQGGGRWVRLLGALLIALAVAAPTAGAAATQDASGDAALDLPAMALTPADLAAAGLDDYVVGVGNLEPLAVEAAWVSRWMGIEKDAAVDAFEEAGVDQAYTMFLDQRAEPGAPDSEVVSTVVSYAYVGDDEAGAEALFHLLAQGASETAQLEVAAEPVGEASSLTFHEGMDPYTGASAAWLALHVHAGRDVIGVAIVDYAGETADPDDALALGERLLDRVAAVRGGDSPGLAPLTLPLAADDEIAHPGPYYLQVDGEALPVATIDSGIGKYVETTSDNVARAAFFEEIGAVDVYFHHQQLGSGEEDGVHDYSYEAVLLRFSDETAAHEYIASLPDRFADDPDHEDLEQLDEAPTAAEEAVAFSYERNYANGRTFFYHPTYVRVGDVIARVDVIGIAPLAEAAAAVAAAQAECLADGGCPDPLEVPADLLPT